MSARDETVVAALRDEASALRYRREALRDGASALRYRRDALRNVAGDDEWALAMVAKFDANALLLDQLAEQKP